MSDQSPPPTVDAVTPEQRLQLIRNRLASMDDRTERAHETGEDIALLLGLVDAVTAERDAQERRTSLFAGQRNNQAARANQMERERDQARAALREAATGLRRVTQLLESGYERYRAADGARHLRERIDAALAGAPSGDTEPNKDAVRTATPGSSGDTPPDAISFNQLSDLLLGDTPQPAEISADAGLDTRHESAEGEAGPATETASPLPAPSHQCAGEFCSYGDHAPAPTVEQEQAEARAGLGDDLYEALADSLPASPPLDQDPVAARLGLVPAPSRDLAALLADGHPLLAFIVECSIAEYLAFTGGDSKDSLADITAGVLMAVGESLADHAALRAAFGDTPDPEPAGCGDPLCQWHGVAVQPTEEPDPAACRDGGWHPCVESYDWCWAHGWRKTTCPGYVNPTAEPGASALPLSPRRPPMAERPFLCLTHYGEPMSGSRCEKGRRNLRDFPAGPDEVCMCGVLVPLSDWQEYRNEKGQADV